MTDDIFEAVAVNQEQFESHVDRTFEKMAEILKEKNRMYGGASMDTGLPGNYIRLHDKMNRYKKLVNNKYAGKDSSFEGIEDTLRDIIGYATIGLAILNAQGKGDPLIKLPRNKSNIPLGGEDIDTREEGRPASHGYVDQD